MNYTAHCTPSSQSTEESHTTQFAVRHSSPKFQRDEHQLDVIFEPLVVPNIYYENSLCHAAFVTIPSSRSSITAKYSKAYSHTSVTSSVLKI